MKKVIMVLGAMCLLVMNTFAQEIQEVPAEVLKAFEGKYAAVKGIVWDQEDDGNWEAEFKMNNQEFSALFTEEGVWVETEQEVTTKELPASLTTMLDTEMAGYTIDDVDLIETPKGKFYRIEVEVDGKEYKLKADMDGKVINKKMRDENKDGLK